MISRVARGWVVLMAGKLVAGPYYSKEYAEEKDREMYAKLRRYHRQQRRSQR